MDLQIMEVCIIFMKHRKIRFVGKVQFFKWKLAHFSISVIFVLDELLTSFLIQILNLFKQDKIIV